MWTLCGARDVMTRHGVSQNLKVNHEKRPRKKIKRTMNRRRRNLSRL
jgi:hypothetical protein